MVNVLKGKTSCWSGTFAFKKKNGIVRNPALKIVNSTIVAAAVLGLAKKILCVPDGETGSVSHQQARVITNPVTGRVAPHRGVDFAGVMPRGACCFLWVTVKW